MITTGIAVEDLLHGSFKCIFYRKKELADQTIIQYILSSEQASCVSNICVDGLIKTLYRRNYIS